MDVTYGSSRSKEANIPLSFVVEAHLIANRRVRTALVFTAVVIGLAESAIHCSKGIGQLAS